MFNKRVLSLFIVLMLVLGISDESINAKESNAVSRKLGKVDNNLSSWMPDEKLQDAVFEVLRWQGDIEDKNQITKEMVKESLDSLYIIDDVDSLKGLEFAEGLYGVTFELKDKKLNDYDLSPFAMNPNKEQISFSTLQWDKSNIRNGDFKEGFKQILEYDLRFSFEIFPIDHIFKVTKDTYKEFSVKTTAFFKPFSEEKDLIFDEEVRYEIDGKYLVYDIDYDKDTDIIHFKLNEESSDDIDYAELEEYLDDYKPETHVSLYDDKFYEHNPLENVNLGGFFFYPKLRAVEPKPVIVKYVDDKNNSISSTETITGIYGSTYTTREKKIKGYKLHKILGNTTGTISDEEQYVTYVFKKDNDMLKVQPVIIKYIDQDGKRLSNDIILKGSLNELYSTKEKSFENYKLVSQPKNKNGYFSSKKQYVIYKYSKVGSTTNRIVEAGDNTGEIVMTLILLVSFLVVSRRYVK